MPRNRRRSRAWVAIVVLAAVLGAGSQLVINADRTAPRMSVGDPRAAAAPVVATAAPVVAPAATAVPRADVVLGVFRGGGGPSELTGFEGWLGRTPRYALTFGDAGTWQRIATSPGLSTWDASSYRLVYSVPLLPTQQAATIATGATGAYDGYFVQLARTLVAHGQQDAILRLGWEFNIRNSRWATTDVTAFKAYWRHVVRAMRSVPGERFEFDWNPVNAHTTYDGSRYYPGGAYVDYVGIDVYDVSWITHTYPWPASCNATCIRIRREAVWEYLENDAHGLLFWSHFARLKGKPMSMPEWGMWTRPDGRGGGDNPIFVRNMHQFITDPTNRVAYQVYFDYDAPDGRHELIDTFPRGGATYRKLFGRNG